MSYPSFFTVHGLTFEALVGNMISITDINGRRVTPSKVEIQLRGVDILQFFFTSHNDFLYVRAERTIGIQLEHWLKGWQFPCFYPAPVTPCPTKFTKFTNPIGGKIYVPAGVVDEDEDDEKDAFKANYPCTFKECPECYGTGFTKGFGGPCSKGCKR